MPPYIGKVVLGVYAVLISCPSGYIAVTKFVFFLILIVPLKANKSTPLSSIVTVTR